MDGGGESYSGVVPAKQPNKSGKPQAEVVEERPLTKENTEEGKPETFKFLGFTHLCGTSQPKGYFTVNRKTIGKRMAAKLKDIQRQLRKRMHEGIAGRGSGWRRWFAGPTNMTPYRRTSSD